MRTYCCFIHPYNNPKNKFVAGFIGQTNFIEVKVENNKFRIENAEFDLPKDFGREDLVIGIRSEKMILGSKTVLAKTDIVEMTGGERIVYFELNNSKCSAKVPLEYNYSDIIELKLDINDMYFFDKITGENLLYS